MSRSIIQQSSFSAGELSPRLHSRTDTSEYAAGLATASNVTVTAHGTIKRRNGSQFIAEAKYRDKECRLVRYQVTQELALILEFGDLYIRFYADNGVVGGTAHTITGITQANPCVVTCGTHGQVAGEHVYIDSVAGMTELNSTTPYVITSATSTTLTLENLDGTAVDSSAYTAYTSGGTATAAYELVSPYDEAEVKDLQITQSANVLYITHPAYVPRVLTRTANNDWTLEEITFASPPTYESGLTSASTTVTPSATTGSAVNLTASTATWLEGDVGRQFVNHMPGKEGIAVITSITSSTVAVCTVIEDFTDTNTMVGSRWYLELSPIVALEVNGTNKGSLVRVRSQRLGGSLAAPTNITNVTQASPGVVSHSGGGTYTDGARVQINDIVGMTMLNNNIYTVNGIGAGSFSLADDNNAALNTTAFTPYSSGGIVREDIGGQPIDAFRAADVGKYILINGGMLKIVTVTSATELECEVLKTLNSDDTASSWSLEEETWSVPRGYPKTVGKFEQRLCFGSTTSQPQTVWMSEAGDFTSFGVGADDEDAISIQISSDEVNEISWMSASRDLVLGTSSGEMFITSGTEGAVTPSTVSQRVSSAFGSKPQKAVLIGNDIMFVQNSGRKLRTLRYDFQASNYISTDTSFLAEHLTEGGISSVIYSQEPDSTLYAILANGDMLIGTYNKTQGVIAWAKEDTDGNYEQAAAIGKDEEDQVWVVVNRRVNGINRRYVELFARGNGMDDLDGFQDSYLTISNNLTVTDISVASTAVVTSASHGLANGVKVIIKDLVDDSTPNLDADKTNMSSLNDKSYTVANVTTNTFELQGLDTSNYNPYYLGGNAWHKIVSITGLDHLEGKTVQIRGDGALLPNEVVTGGAVTLDYASGEVVIGLPYTSTIKTLDVDFSMGAGSMIAQRARWAKPKLRVIASMSPMLNGEFLPSRSTADLMGVKIPLATGYLDFGSLKWADGTSLTITIDTPFPFEMSGITGVINSGVK